MITSQFIYHTVHKMPPPMIVAKHSGHARHVCSVQPLRTHGWTRLSETPVPAILALPFGLLGRLFTARWQLFVVVGVGEATEVAIIIEVIRVIFQLS